MKAATNRATGPIQSPFELGCPDLYARWKKRKLDEPPIDVADDIVEIRNPASLQTEEYQALLRGIRRHNMAIYRSAPGLQDKSLVAELGAQFGLRRLDNNLCADEDSITSLTVMEAGRHKGYIPYSNRQLNWHTDGYYNTGEDQIRGFILHCVQDAVEGGDSALLDHQRIYLMMREQDPALVAAMMAPDAMTIPPNIEAGEAIRGEQTGPVFSIDGRGNLHMRYTKRKRNIEWKQDSATLEAVAFIEEVLESDNPYIVRAHLHPGEGLICNNVLHSRTEFRDDPESGHKRLLYRARCYDRVTDTDVVAGED